MGQYFINETLRRSLLTVLSVRKLSATSEQLATIQRCIDQQILNQWMERAIVASTADEVFAPSAP
jgi:hypothetical protein